MRIQALVFSVWTLLELFNLGCTASDVVDFAFPLDHSLVHNYSRFTEIKSDCNPYLSLASELEPDGSRGDRLKNELSFFNGDWEQEAGVATLMPFDDSDMPWASSSFISPWKLVSFEVKNVSYGLDQQPKNTVSLSGVLSIGITRNSTLISEPDLKFYKRPGMSALRVDFEGVYLETQENGGERLVCLLGNSTFPFRKVSDGFSDDHLTSYFAIRDTYNEEPLILPYDQILLVLRYPKRFALSTRAVHGEMTSLNNKEDFSNYFDKVHITSQLGVFSEYQFSGFEELVSENFDQNPLQEAMEEDGVNRFNTSEFCNVMKYFETEAYKVMPNLKLGGQNAFQDAVGPFVLEKEIQLVDRNNENLRLIMQNIICREGKFSGVLRMYPATIEPHVATRRTGLSSLTLSVEGKWNSSTGLLSLVSCLGSKPVKCDSGILLYFPKSFSSKQRSVISGSIFSFKSTMKPYWPVFFRLEMLSTSLHNRAWYFESYLSYNYSKSDFAVAFSKRSQEPQWMITYIKKSFYRYPALEEEKDGIFTSLNRLADDLRIDTFSSTETFVRIEILSLGPLFRTPDSHLYGYGSANSVDIPEVSKYGLLNISLSLSLIEAPVKVKERYYRHVSKLDLEGLYDPGVGILYLIGCRKVDFDHVDLERGLDCSIEVTIEHSPETTRWLINPTAKITIASQRNEDDTYYFSPVRLQTFMIHDRKHEKNVLFRKFFEGCLRVLLLLVFIVLILSQLKYMKKYPKTIPYISRVTLGVWIFGYGLILIRAKEILIKSLESVRYMDQPYNHQSWQAYFEALDYLARFLLLVSLLLMARLYQLVLKSRKELRVQGEPTPSEKKVVLVSFGIYMCWLLLKISLVGLVLKLEGAVSKDVYVKEIRLMLAYEVQAIQDYFLIPQMIALRIWKPHCNSGPLCRSFFYGSLWISSIIPLLYDFIRDPIAYPA